MNLRNSVQLIGKLGKNPAIKSLENGKILAKVSIATNDSYKNAKGEKVVETQWHNLIAWGKTAQLMERFLTKGMEVCIQGKLTHRSYEDSNGVTKYFSEVIISEFLMLGKAKES